MTKVREIIDLYNINATMEFGNENTLVQIPLDATDDWNLYLKKEILNLG